MITLWSDSIETWNSSRFSSDIDYAEKSLLLDSAVQDRKLFRAFAAAGAEMGFWFYESRNFSFKFLILLRQEAIETAECPTKTSVFFFFFIFVILQ